MRRSSNRVPMMPTITLTPAAQRSLANWKLSTAGEPEVPISANASERPGVDELPPNDPGLERRWRVFFLLAAAIAAVAAGWWLFDNDVAGHLGQGALPGEPSSYRAARPAIGKALPVLA